MKKSDVLKIMELLFDRQLEIAKRSKSLPEIMVEAHPIHNDIMDETDNPPPSEAEKESK